MMGIGVPSGAGEAGTGLKPACSLESGFAALPNALTGWGLHAQHTHTTSGLTMAGFSSEFLRP